MRTRHLLLGTLAAGLVAAGCGSDNSGPVATTAAPAAATTAASTATTASSTATTTARSTATTTAGAATTSGDQAAVEPQAEAALLTPAEVGPGFTAATWTANDPTQPTPCGTPSADATVPPDVQTGTVIELASTSQALQEEISVYAGEQQADDAYRSGSAGLSCTAGTLTFGDGTTAALEITAPVDVTDQVGGDEANAWQLHGGGIQGVLVAVRLASIVVTFQFVAPDTATDLQPPPLAVAKAGMDKILKS